MKISDENLNEKIMLSVEAKQIYDCFDSVLISVFDYLNWSYELLIFDEWQFEFDKLKFFENHKLSQNIKIGRKHRWDYLEKYHGIKILNMDINENNDFERHIRISLLKNIPVLACIDLYWCPWFPEYYLKYTDLHEVIIVGISDNSFILKDFQYACNGVEVSFDEFRKCLKVCRFFEKKDDIKVFDWQIEIANMAKKLLSSNMFNEIKDFADGLSRESLDEDVRDFNGAIYTAPLLEDISYIGMTRIQVASSIQYICEKYSISVLNKIVADIKKLGLKWSSLFGMLCKIFCIQEEKRDFILQRVQMRIKEIAITEQKVIEELLNLVNEEIKEKSINTNLEKNRNICNFTMFDKVDISKYFNTNGISNCVDYECLSSFTSDGRYIYVNKSDVKKLCTVKNIPFDIGNILKYQNDHISCFGEYIKLKTGIYKKAFFLCCADLGSQCDKVEIMYTDKSVEEVELNVTSWLKNPEFDEEIALVCHGVAKDHQKKTAFMYPFDSYLFMQSLEVNENKECCVIKLPICPNIHIFALTMAK